MLCTDGVVGRVVTSIRFLSWGERESGGLLDMSGEEVTVPESIKTILSSLL